MAARADGVGPGTRNVECRIHLESLRPFRRHPERFYFRIGKLDAPLETNWKRLGQGAPKWSSLAPAFGLVSALCAWIFVSDQGLVVSKPWTMMPWAVLFAGINAFGEEFLYRNALVPAVQTDFSTQQALLVSATIFGIGHWNGLPAGSIGVAMTFVLGYITGKAMVDTKGMFWPWVMHMLPDCVLFYYWGIGAVAHRTFG